MIIEDSVFDGAHRAGRAYTRLKEYFGQFFGGIQHLAGDQSHIKGVELEAAPGADGFDFSFSGIKLRFHFSVHRNAEGNLRGLVIVERKAPSFNEHADIVGTFDFDGHGITNFETANGEGGLEIGYNAEKIVWYYFGEALAKPLP